MSSECVLRSLKHDFVPAYLSYELSRKNEAYYTGGHVQFTSDGRHVVTTCGSAVKVLTVDTGTVEKKIEEVSVHCIAP